MIDLLVSDLYTAYDRADVLHGVSLHARAGEITCILGANGAGKSTLIRSVLGLTPPHRGSIRLGEAELTGRPTHRIVAMGIACIPEGRKVFPRLCVRENLLAGAYRVGSREQVRENLEQVLRIFPRLEERAGQLAGTLSGGEQAMLSIGRGLMSRPRLLIIDEPSLGLSPLLVKENFNVIRRVNETGVSVLLVEQNVNQTLAIAHRGYVLAQGRVVAEGSAAALRDDAEVQRAYFG
ncbi:MAG: ABC transporter ATP-binding protein [Burkholderiales bacterium]|nr:ABC transporter ATP-binding protein [Burkholderiales bacterium]MCW5623055.1 ABC transporter ATP-binding protein [Burkholderiales bacterium]